MLKKQNVKKSNDVKVTFVLDGDNANLPASVVGDFNEWDPAATPLKKRSNGTYSANATLASGQRHRFRYVSADGVWFNDDAADAYELGEAGEDNCIVEL
jgi:1,4-alpha-glucan branching enzyme